MQSCLEVRGMAERNNEIARSDYYSGDTPNAYSRDHKDAISDGDIYGKGSPNIQGHTYWKPRYYNGNNDMKNVMKYDNFDTSPESNIGCCYDIKGREGNSGRERAFAANIFTNSYQYSVDIIGTQLKK